MFQVLFETGNTMIRSVLESEYLDHQSCESTTFLSIFNILEKEKQIRQLIECLSWRFRTPLLIDWNYSPFQVAFLEQFALSWKIRKKAKQRAHAARQGGQLLPLATHSRDASGGDQNMPLEEHR
jgi:hypothetical protein